MVVGAALALGLAPLGGPPADARQDRALPARPMQRILDRHAETFDVMEVGLVVTDDAGEVVVAREPDRALLPASTMKVLTAAAVLDVMEPDHRLVTTVTSPSPVTPRGIVPGLRIVGAGDPALTTLAHRVHVHPARPSSDLEALANRVVAAGVRRVRGDVVGDEHLFGPTNEPAGWPDRYVAEGDGRYISALTLNGGRLVDTRGAPPGALLGIRPDPLPGLNTAWEFARLLRQRGVRVDGVVRRSFVAADKAHVLARVASPPVGELVQFLLEESDNHVGDTLLRAAAAAEYGQGDWAAARSLVARSTAVALAEPLLGQSPSSPGLPSLALPVADLAVDDGSGLSRLNRVTARTFAGIDRAMVARHGTSWDDWLSTAGVDGTFSGRLVGTSAQGRFHGKSGTLADVKAVVGHVDAASGRRLHIAILANDVPPGLTWRIALLADDLTLAATDALDGCTRVRRRRVAVPGGQGSVPQPVPLTDGLRWRRVCPDQ